MRVETYGIRISMRAAEEKSTHDGELEDLLGDFLERVDALVEPDCDLRRLVAACKLHAFREPGGFRDVLALLFDDLVRTLLGRRFWR